MRFCVIAEYAGFFYPEEFEEYTDDIHEVISKVKEEVNTPKFIEFLQEKNAEQCSICIIDFEQSNAVFLYVEVEIKLVIKQYE